MSLVLKAKKSSVNAPESSEGPETSVQAVKGKAVSKSKQPVVTKAEKVAKAEPDFSAPAKSGSGRAIQVLLDCTNDPKTNEELVTDIHKDFPEYNGKFISIARSEINAGRAARKQVEALKIKLPLVRFIKDEAGNYIAAKKAPPKKK
jgi:hypothetical protein